jgi:endoglycosylceramidase
VGGGVMAASLAVLAAWAGPAPVAVAEVTSSPVTIGASHLPAATDAAVPHVVRRGADRVIVGRDGRQLLLRGINTNALVDYPDDFQQTVPMTRADIDEMAALGFDFLRLPLSWSRLEPQPGEYSQDYLDQAREIVEWAEDAGMSVLLDMHQDRYHRDLRPGDEADGAPDWATVTDGQPCYNTQLTSPCSVAAYDAFWENREVEGKPLQTWYRDVLLRVSREFRDDNRLLGIELMNEPTPGSMQSPAWERAQLWPFESAMIDALRADGERRMIWFGPSILRDVFDKDYGQPEPFTTDPDIVYAPHIYTGTFNGGGPAQLRGSYANAVAEARAYRAALVDAEWGGGSSPTEEKLRAANLRLQDKNLVGSAFWMWKQLPGFYNWHTVEADGQLRQDSMRAQMLSRPHVSAVPGRLLRVRYADGVLKVRLKSDGGRATLWGGTVVRSGGDSLLAKPLVKATIDGKRAQVTKQARRFSVGDTSLVGHRVIVRVPRGTHTIELRARG